jgi:hypothetical protein
MSQPPSPKKQKLGNTLVDFSTYPSDDPRLGHFIQPVHDIKQLPAPLKPGKSIALVGFPWDEVWFPGDVNRESGTPLTG